jgi:hypothetical protein
MLTRIIIIASAIVLSFGSDVSAVDLPPLSEAELQQIRPVVYRYISTHRMDATIIDITRRSRLEAEVGVTGCYCNLVIRKFADGWRVLRIETYEPDREIVR